MYARRCASMLLMAQLIETAKSGTATDRVGERAYRMRACGFGLGFVALASVLVQIGAHPVTWGLLLVNALAWPPLARTLSQRAGDAAPAEVRNLLIDSAMGGVWIALMQFNLLPSVLLALVLAIDKMHFGGWPLLVRGIAVQLAACVLTVAIHGLYFMPQTTMANVFASLPLLIVYPLALSASAYSLARLVREQNRQLLELHHAGMER